MKPVDFEYFDPVDKAEALTLLREHGEDGKIIAGGQSLLPMLNFRIVRPKTLIDVNRIPGFDAITTENGYLRIGALTTESAIEASEAVRTQIPVLAAATRHIGHSAIRNRGTIGGSIAHADPAAEYPLLMKLLGASFQIESAEGARWVTAEQFFLDYLTVDLQRTEMITQIKVPVPPAGAAWAFQELARRHGDFAIVAAAVVLVLSPDGRCTEARIGLGGAGPLPLRATAAEERLAGVKITESVIDEVARLAAEAADPTGDMHASAEYRRDMAQVFTRKCLVEALQRHKENK